MRGYPDINRHRFLRAVGIGEIFCHTGVRWLHHQFFACIDGAHIRYQHVVGLAILLHCHRIARATLGMAGVIMNCEFYTSQFNDFAVADNLIDLDRPERFQATKVRVAKTAIF